jgi:coenzyme F420-reducing hydrogenase beta subunit
MQTNGKGFLYPHIDLANCIQCGLCETVCPLRNQETASRAGVTSVIKAFALRLKDKDILYRSSSGGAFFSIANYVIGHGGIVFGAIYDENMVVRHSYASTIEECKKFQGSKYSQSDLTGVYAKAKEFLKANKLVMFSGTPCQNHGLLKFLKHNYENLLTVDLICHSVPSPLFFKDYLNMIETKYNDRIISVSMRDKTLGWGSIESYRYFFKSGNQILNPPSIKGWQTIFESGLITRECCFDCHYTNLNRITDLTIGDFWDSNCLRPDISSKEGTSILLINTERGNRIFNSIKDSVQYWKVTENEYMQPRLFTSTAAPKKYKKFWNHYYKKGFQNTYYLFFVHKSLITRIASKLIKILK